LFVRAKQKTTQSIGTKLFLNDCGHNREGYRVVFTSNLKDYNFQ